MKITAKALCDFMKNIEWDTEDSRSLAHRYMDHYEDDEVNLMKTLSLWKIEYSLSPLIQEFNHKMLMKCTDDMFALFLPQLVAALKNNRDKSIRELIIDRCCKNDKLSIQLFWMLMVEIEKNSDKIYGITINRMLVRLSTCDNGVWRREALKKQGNLVEKLLKISGLVRESRTGIAGKKLMIIDLLRDGSFDLLLFDPIPLPIRPEHKVIGIVPEECTVFQSQLSPMLLTFQRKDGQTFRCIFKSGDDLRQDKIVLQSITLMRDILLENGLDMKIVVYDILSTGLQHGFVEYIESESLDNILQREKGLATVLRGAKQWKLDPVKMDNFVKTTACYTIMTYILCIGDRHLDNIMLTADGRLFHIDYGFIAREPKPFAPATKLCKEIVQIMGGRHSGYYAEFMSYCMECFCVLRMSHERILDSLLLMCDAGISDITEDTVEKIKKRFHLELSDNDVAALLTVQIERSFESVIPKMMDSFHHAWKSTELF